MPTVPAAPAGAPEFLIADTETNGLLKAVSKFHCLQLGNAEGDDSVLYGSNPLCDEPIENGLRRLEAAAGYAGHNFLGYDIFIGDRFLNGAIKFDKSYDTLVMARMAEIKERNHSLAVWGSRLGVPKDDYKGDYQTFDEEFAKYSRQDIVVGRGMWHRTKHVLDWGKDQEVYWVEASSHYCASLMEQNGFLLDVPAAQKLHAGMAQERADLIAQIRGIFPDFSRASVFIPKRDNKKLGYKKDVPFTKKWEDEFNPQSRKMIGEALIRDGWKPKVFTDGGQPKVDEDTLSSLDHPGAKLLTRYLRLSKVVGAIMGEKQGKGYLQLVDETNRLHGRCNTLGAVTWRASHSNPNKANVDKDKRVRSLFIVPPKKKLVGVDGAEIQARFLAHYLSKYDDGLYAEKLLKGDKKLGTDGHTLNKVSLADYGLKTRDGAKTALYARIFGCFPPRMFATINDDRRTNGEKMFPEVLSMAKRAEWKDWVLAAAPALEDPIRKAFTDGQTRVNLTKLVGQGAIDALGRSMPGLDALLRDVQAAGKARGFLWGVDGAQVPVAAVHAALVSLLQHGEARAMKRAQMILWREEAPKRGWKHGREFSFCSFVHDEYQSEVVEELAVEYGDVFSWCIEEAGRRMNLRCPLGGEAKVGNDWYETH
jgi:DNA polymerase-1